jgi:hypothetical protein
MEHICKENARRDNRRTLKHNIFTLKVLSIISLDPFAFCNEAIYCQFNKDW